jgi:hypothetical protein
MVEIRYGERNEVDATGCPEMDGGGFGLDIVSVRRGDAVSV